MEQPRPGFTLHMYNPAFRHSSRSKYTKQYARTFLHPPVYRDRHSAPDQTQLSALLDRLRSLPKLAWWVELSRPLLCPKCAAIRLLDRVDFRVLAQGLGLILHGGDGWMPARYDAFVVEGTACTVSLTAGWGVRVSFGALAR